MGVAGELFCPRDGDGPAISCGEGGGSLRRDRPR